MTQPVKDPLLAWIRTGLAVMGFGFVVARFGLFLRELGAAAPNIIVRSTGFSLWTGTALVLAGVVVNAVSTAHVRVAHQDVKRERVHVFRPTEAMYVPFQAAGRRYLRFFRKEMMHATTSLTRRYYDSRVAPRKTRYPEVAGRKSCCGTSTHEAE